MTTDPDDSFDGAARHVAACREQLQAAANARMRGECGASDVRAAEHELNDALVELDRTTDQPW